MTAETPKTAGDPLVEADERVRVYGPDGEPEDLVLRTESGRVLTEADINQLAEEAPADSARFFLRRFSDRLSAAEALCEAAAELSKHQADDVDERLRYVYIQPDRDEWQEFLARVEA